jgi:hypothetical protein
VYLQAQLLNDTAKFCQMLLRAALLAQLVIAWGVAD